MTERWRRGMFLAGAAVLAAFILWGLAGLPGFGRYPGPYGDIINRVAVAQTNATGVVSAVNFSYRGFDTVGEEFILFTTAAGVAPVLRHLRGEDKVSTRQEALDRVAPPASDALRVAALAFTGPAIVLGWWLATHAQTSPSGGFQGGVLLTTGFVLVYLAGQVLLFRRVSPEDLTDVAEAVGAVPGPALPQQLPAAGQRGGGGELVGDHRADQLPGRHRGRGGVPAHHRRADGSGAAGAGGPGMSFLPFVVVAWVLVAGLYGIVTSRHLVHQIICLIVVQSSTYVLLLAVGYRTGAVAPYFYDVPVHTPAVDPVVQALALTDVVVEAAVTALLLAFAVQAHKRFGTLDPHELVQIRG
jgi:multisubunit Na+/H+ antiporter MnhC subunit/multisubunit Na+/H+ antiporter MnhB subunit